VSKLNKIFYGPAGTGKTRSATIEAVKKVCESKLLNISFDKNNYDDIENKLKSFSETPSLNITNGKIVKAIQENSLDTIINNESYEGSLKYLTEKKVFDRDEVEEKILAYKKIYNIYPLIDIVTFHPSYSYQDFIEGITVETKETDGLNEIAYIVKDGIFKKICERAINQKEYNYVLIIDEINRGDISSIFGELFTLIEDDKREGSLQINLPYSKDENENPKKLIVPSNLYILATMNTVDKSIALIDVALRRRFDFIECMPNSNLKEFEESEKKIGINLSSFLETINKRIRILKNEHYQIGHSYFLNINDFKDFKKIIKTKIIPLLQEYFYDDWKSICAVLNQPYETPNISTGLLESESMDDNLFLPDFNDLIEYSNQTIFKIREDFNEEDIKEIY
jgi:5-methylcytosine-specific restriction endonuclease McrBC GTP-binding regulatory subunit McrB